MEASIFSKRQFESYNEFSTATLTDVYDEGKLEKGLHYQVKSFASVYLFNLVTTTLNTSISNDKELALTLR